MTQRSHSFVPALGFDWLTPLYDPLLWLLGEVRAKRRLLEKARIAPGMSVLDFGCGTGTLAVLAKQLCPGARVVGVDVDARILERARSKAAQAGVEIDFRHGPVDEVGLAAGSCDRIVTSLVLHHLTAAEKQRALRSLRGLLRPGGELHVADFGPPASPLMWLASRLVRTLDGAERIDDNLSGRLPGMIATAGFADVTEVDRMATPFGTLVYLRASARPA